MKYYFVAFRFEASDGSLGWGNSFSEREGDFFPVREFERLTAKGKEYDWVKVIQYKEISKEEYDFQASESKEEVQDE